MTIRDDREASEQDAGMPTKRLEAFSDGIFAIVVTLLILEVHVPMHVGPNVSASLRRDLGFEMLFSIAERGHIISVSASLRLLGDSDVSEVERSSPLG